jgi:hypothetical protein
LEKSHRLIVHGSQISTEATGNAKSRRGVVDSLTIGPHRFFNLTVTEGRQNALSLTFLKRFNLEIDFPQQKVYFHPSKKIDCKDQFFRPGFAVTELDQSIVAVRQGDTEPDIQEGDKFLKINGSPAAELGLKKVWDLIEKPGTTLSLVIERNGKIHELTIKLSEAPEVFPKQETYELIDDSKSPEF